ALAPTLELLLLGGAQRLDLAVEDRLERVVAREAVLDGCRGTSAARRVLTHGGLVDRRGERLLVLRVVEVALRVHPAEDHVAALLVRLEVLGGVEAVLARVLHDRDEARRLRGRDIRRR